MKYYVYYAYGYYDDGAVGFTEFDKKEEAEEWIKGCLKGLDKDKIADCFTIIEGTELSLEPTEVVASVKIGRNKA